eukprot:sb/3464209/
MDLSDECNDRCSKHILKGFYLKSSAFAIGSLAIALNLLTLISVILELRQIKNQIALENKVLVATISLGDLLTGAYLLTIAIFDATQTSYCEEKAKWLASKYCNTMGIVSTTGSAISVISMTFLSLARVKGVRSGLHRSTDEVKFISPLITASAIIVISVIFAVFPVILLKQFEDMFGNGQVWDTDLKFFIGIISKAEHLEVIEAYYGRILRNPSGTGQSWDKITALIRGMYTNDYGNLEGSNSLVGFYGNEGVCLFKFFVLPDDPQFAFSLTYQILNIICLSVICSCYAYIEATSRKSLEDLHFSRENAEQNPAIQARIDSLKKMQLKITIMFTILSRPVWRGLGSGCCPFKRSLKRKMAQRLLRWKIWGRRTYRSDNSGEGIGDIGTWCDPHTQVPAHARVQSCRVEAHFPVRDEHETRGHTHVPSLEVAVGYKLTTGISVYLYTVKVRGDATYLRFLWRPQTNEHYLLAGYIKTARTPTEGPPI